MQTVSTLIRRRVLHCLPMSLLWDARFKWVKSLFEQRRECVRSRGRMYSSVFCAITNDSVNGQLKSCSNALGMHSIAKTRLFKYIENFTTEFSDKNSDIFHISAQVLVNRLEAGLGGSVGCASDWWSGGCRFDPRRADNILSWRLIMKYFLRSFCLFRWFKKDSCQFLAKEFAQYWLNA